MSYYKKRYVFIVKIPQIIFETKIIVPIFAVLKLKHNGKDKRK